MDLSLVQGSTTIVLNGTGAAAPVRAGRADLATPGAVVLEIALDGTPASIASFAQGVERALYAATRLYGAPGESWGYLYATLPDSTVWRAAVISGACESVQPGSRAVGSMGLRIRLALAPWWESTTVSDVALTNKYGANVTTGIQVDNHDDAGHDNFVNISGASILGDVPAPAILTYSSGSACGMDLMLSQIVNNNASYNPTLEGESASGTGLVNTSTADANCSNGNYGAGSWAGTGAVSLAWSISATDASYLEGRIFRPALRLRDLVAGGESIWAYWSVVYVGTGNNTIARADGLLLPTDQRVVVFPAMALPPWPKPPSGYTWEGFNLVLNLQAAGAGAHVFNLDFAQLQACDGWQRYLPLATLMAATQIRHDLGTGQITRTSTAMASHAPDGAGLWLWPGLNSRVVALCQAGTSADTAWSGTLKMQYRQRKRSL